MTKLIVGIRQLVALRGGPVRTAEGMSEVDLIDNGALLIRNGRILEVGTKSEVQSLVAGDAERIDFDGRVVTPGLIDAHTHALFAKGRSAEFEMRSKGASYQDIAASGGGILSSMRAIRESSDDELRALLRRNVSWMRRCGTTTFECKTGYGLNAESELRMANLIREATPHGTFLGAHAVPPESASRGSYIDDVVSNQLPLCAPLCQSVDIFVERNYFTPDDAERLAAAAKQYRLDVRMHVDQITNGGGAALAAKLKARTAEHLEQTDEDGVRSLYEGGVIPVLLPASVYCLGLNKYPNARAMIDIGLPIVLATDFNPGSSPTPSLPFVMSLACTQMMMSPAESLIACTVNAANALRIGGAGQLQVDWCADFVAWDIEDWRELPYWTGIELAHSVYKQGNEVFRR